MKLRKVSAYLTLAIGISTPLYSIIKTPVTKPWLRLEGAVANLRISPKANFMAFTENDGKNLRLINTQTHEVLTISRLQVGQAFFWSPDGTRLFYRELSKNKNQEVVSNLKAYDTSRAGNVNLERFPHVTGLLNFDPRDLRMHFMTNKGLASKRLVYPDERLARWQIAQRTEHGKWVATHNAILWAQDGGFTMRRMEDDQTTIQSFDISPDGSSIAWATTGGRVYMSTNGQEPKSLGFGADPRWHPYKSYLLYSHGRRVGNKTIGFDLKVIDNLGNGKLLTNTQETNERWGNWHPNGHTVYFTHDGSTDLFELNFSNL